MTDLSDKMRELAATGHVARAVLTEAADKFDEATAGFYAEPQAVGPKTFLGAWARARRIWSDCSGEPLV